MHVKKQVFLSKTGNGVDLTSIFLCSIIFRLLALLLTRKCLVTLLKMLSYKDFIVKG
jgi:hypothetical protein